MNNCMHGDSQDFYAWTQTQAQLLQRRQWEELDVEGLIEVREPIGGFGSPFTEVAISTKFTLS